MNDLKTQITLAKIQASKFKTGRIGYYEGITIKPGAKISGLDISMIKDLCQALLAEQYSFRVLCNGYLYTVELEDQYTFNKKEDNQ